MFLANKKMDNQVKTHITYNRGRDWRLLQAPSRDLRGNSIHCVLVSSLSVRASIKEKLDSSWLIPAAMRGPPQKEHWPSKLSASGLLSWKVSRPDSARWVDLPFKKLRGKEVSGGNQTLPFHLSFFPRSSESLVFSLLTQWQSSHISSGPSKCYPNVTVCPQIFIFFFDKPIMDSVASLGFLSYYAVICQEMSEF